MYMTKSLIVIKTVKTHEKNKRINKTCQCHYQNDLTKTTLKYIHIKNIIFISETIICNINRPQKSTISFSI